MDLGKMLIRKCWLLLGVTFGVMLSGCARADETNVEGRDNIKLNVGDPTDCMVAIYLEREKSRKANRNDLYVLQTKAFAKAFGEHGKLGYSDDILARRGILTLYMLDKNSEVKEKFTQDCLNKYLQN